MNNNIRSWRSPAVIVFMLVLAVIIAGCGNVMPSGPVVPDPNGGKNGNGEGVDPTPTDPDPGDKDPTPSEPDPGDDDPLPDPADLAKGDGAPAPLDGRVVFGDTGLGLRSTVDFTDERGVPTDDGGNFQAILPTGNTGYIVRTLLRAIHGAFDHSGQNQRELNVPEFDGYSNASFNELLTTKYISTSMDGEPVHYGPFTTRWPIDARIPVWIDTTNLEEATESHVKLAFERWQEIVGHAIRFDFAKDRNDAENGITIEFVPQSRITDEYDSSEETRKTIGLYSAWYDPNTDASLIARGSILIDVDRQTSSALLLHEIGHCIGLSGHSPDANDVMHGTLSDPNKQLSEKEKQMARLLYSIPAGTPAFSDPSDGMAMMATPSTPHHVTYNPDGTVTVTIPTFASPTD